MPGLDLIGFGASMPAGALLLDGSEADGTNVFIDTSVGMNGGNWFTAGATLTNATAVSPSGATNASSVIENSATSRHIVFQQIGSRTANAPIRLSVYCKYSNRRFIQMMYSPDSGTPGDCYAYFDLQTGAVTNSGVTGGAQSVANVTSAAAVNGFYKFSFDALASATSVSGYCIFAMSNVSTFGAPLDSNNPQYTGDGASVVYLWRPKLVQL